MATVASTPGPAVADDTDAQTPGGTWCYGVRFDEPGYQAAPSLVLLQVDGVPEPPNAPPVASFRAFPTEGSITEFTNEVFLSDDSSDDGRAHRRLAVGPGRRHGVRRRVALARLHDAGHLHRDAAGDRRPRRHGHGDADHHDPALTPNRRRYRGSAPAATVSISSTSLR